MSVSGHGSFPPWHILCQSLFRARRFFPFFEPFAALVSFLDVFFPPGPAAPFNSRSPDSPRVYPRVYPPPGFNPPYRGLTLFHPFYRVACPLRLRLSGGFFLAPLSSCFLSPAKLLIFVVSFRDCRSSSSLPPFSSSFSSRSLKDDLRRQTPAFHFQLVSPFLSTLVSFY